MSSPTPFGGAVRMSPAKKNGTSAPSPQGGRPSPRLVRGDETPEPPRILQPCVVLAPASKPLNDALHRALRAEHLTPRVEHDPRMAMAELCLLRREASQRRGATSETELPAALVLVATPTGDEVLLLEALRRHVPDVPVLQFDGTTLEQVHTPKGIETREPPVIVQPPVRLDVTDDELSTLLPPLGRQDQSNGSSS
jgi:hypothetical protein